jgi:transposase-like protein
MSYNEMGLLVQLNPVAAKARILEAYRQAGGHVGQVAEMLGASRRSLERWVTHLRLRPEIGQILRSAGRKPPGRRAGVVYAPAAPRRKKRTA